MKGRRKRVIPGFGLSMGVTLTMLSFVVLIPLISLVVYTSKLSFHEIVETLTMKRVLSSFYVSFVTAFIASLINAVMGLVLAWVLVRYQFPGKRIIDGMIELPFALPTAVAGIALTYLTTDQGWIGKFFAKFGIEIAYTKLGITVALIFVGIPFVVRSVQPVLEKLDGSYEEAAGVLGASKSRIFWKVIFPEVKPALFTGFGLAFGRCLGEYGSVVFIAGNKPYSTEITPLIIMSKLQEFDYASATAIALVMLLVAFLILFSINLVQAKNERKVNGGGQVRRKSKICSSIEQTFTPVREAIENISFSIDEKVKSRRRKKAALQGEKKKPFQNREKREILLRRVLIGISIIFLFVMLVLPLGVVLSQAFRNGVGQYVKAVTDEYTVKALLLTLEATVIAVVVNTIFGVFAAWAITKFQFKGKKLLTTFIDIPVTISPVIAGLIFILLFGRNSFLYPYLQTLKISVVFAVPGIVLATIFVTFPFISRELIPVLEAEGTDEEEAAALMGASGFTIFRKITFPHIKWAFLYGVVLCTARAMGEFGAVSVLSGHLRGLTNTLPLHIEILFNEFQYIPAFAVSSVLVVISVVILVIRSVLEYKGKKKAE